MLPSAVGRTAAVVIGASETSLYVVAVYFSAAGVKESRWAIPAALCADLVCFVSGVQLICLGIIAEYIGKIYMETKQRPRYIISERTWEESGE